MAKDGDLPGDLLPTRDSAHLANITAPFTDTSCPKFLIIGAGARGNAYARAVTESTIGIIAAVAEPAKFKREALGKKYIWFDHKPQIGQSFQGWQDFIVYERQRRKAQQNGDQVQPGIDGVFICVLDELHAEVILGLQELSLHVMRPTLRDALSIGDILSIEHTEPVGWWHFSHSYVRGNWRKESITAPSLLTKSCHDIDFLLWLLCSPPPGSDIPPHLPSYVSSTGSLKYFKSLNKPALAGSSTNCYSCPAERECIYSAKNIYQKQHLAQGNAGWPVHIVDPEIEDCLSQDGQAAAAQKLQQRLVEDYDSLVPQEFIDSRPWFGRCVYESSNDVCDDQIVTISWEDDSLPLNSTSNGHASLPNRPRGRGAKTAVFHMIAFTEAQCERRGRIYGSKGEITYDSKSIRVYDFASKESQTWRARQMGGGHGGGDDGLATQYVLAVDAVKKGRMSAEEAQMEYVGCSLEEVIRSHAMVFAAEEARKERSVVDWGRWWKDNVEGAYR